MREPLKCRKSARSSPIIRQPPTHNGFYLFSAAWLELLRTAGLISPDTWHSAWSITNRAL